MKPRTALRAPQVRRGLGHLDCMDTSAWQDLQEARLSCSQASLSPENLRRRTAAGQLSGERRRTVTMLLPGEGCKAMEGQMDVWEHLLCWGSDGRGVSLCLGPHGLNQETRGAFVGKSMFIEGLTGRCPNPPSHPLLSAPEVLLSIPPTRESRVEN